MDIKVLGILFSAFLLQTTSGYVEEVFKWKRVEYENLPKSKHSWIGPYKYYIPENNGIDNMGYHPASGLMIVALVRLRPGIPTSLAAFCVNDYGVGSSPKIWGFPNYQLNTLQASDFSGGREDDEGRRAWKKPNKYNYGGYYNNFHGSHHYIHRIPFYEKPKETPILPSLDIKRIISVFLTTIDEKCDRVFFIDNGQLQYYRNTTYTMENPSLWVIGLPSNGCETRDFPILRRSELPDKIAAKGHNGFMNVFLDYQSEDSCDDLFLYITNTFYNFLTVYDYRKDEFWTFDHQTFQPVASESYFVFDKTYNYQMLMGIYSIALGFVDDKGDRTAYYTSVASTAQFSVSTKILKDKRKSPTNFNSDDFKIMGYLGCDHQPLKSVIDYIYEVMFYADVQTNEIRCWNINKPLNPDNIDVVFKSDKYFFGPQMFIDSRGYLWFHSTHIPVEYSSDIPLDLTKVNARIFRVRVSDAIRGTICDDGDQYRLSYFHI